VRGNTAVSEWGDPTAASLAFDSAIGIGICLALVLATNAIFVGDWVRLGAGTVVGLALSFWLLKRNRADSAEGRSATPPLVRIEK
jgi:hypothetical protein